MTPHRNRGRDSFLSKHVRTHTYFTPTHIYKHIDAKRSSKVRVRASTQEGYTLACVPFVGSLLFADSLRQKDSNSSWRYSVSGHIS